MKQHEARAFVDLTHTLLTRAANADPSTDPLTEDEESQLLELEDEAIALLSGALDDFRIITSERSTAVNRAGQPLTEDPRDLRFNRHQAVERIEINDAERVVTIDDQLQHITVTTYEAHGGDSKATPNTYAFTRSGPEGFIDGKPFGAASALVARLLEARAAGLA